LEDGTGMGFEEEVDECLDIYEGLEVPALEAGQK